MSFDRGSNLNEKKDCKSIAVVHWIDAAYAEADHDGPIACITCGVFVREDEESITLALDHFADNVIRHVTSIPKSCIVKRRYYPVNWKIGK